MTGNRHQRRRTKAIAKRINGRPGTGLNKRSAAKVKVKTNWHKRIMLEMRDNDVVIENASSGALDAYFK